MADNSKRERGTWHLVTKSKGHEEHKTVRELRARLKDLKKGDMIVLIKGKKHDVKTQTVEEVAIV